jgi:hypothetical protein
MIIVLLFIQVIILPNAGCKKDAPPATDTIKRVDTIIPKPVVDTPIYISKLEEVRFTAIKQILLILRHTKPILFIMTTPKD